MLQNNTDSTGSFSKDIRNAGVQEGQPVLAASLASIKDYDWSIGTWDIVPHVNPVPLPESGGVRGEVVEGLCKPLLRKFIGHVPDNRCLIGLRILDNEGNGSGVLPARLVVDELQVDGLWTMPKAGDI